MPVVGRDCVSWAVVVGPAFGAVESRRKAVCVVARRANTGTVEQYLTRRRASNRVGHTTVGNTRRSGWARSAGQRSRATVRRSSANIRDSSVGTRSERRAESRGRDTSRAVLRAGKGSWASSRRVRGARDVAAAIIRVQPTNASGRTA